MKTWIQFQLFDCFIRIFQIVQTGSQNCFLVMLINCEPSFVHVYKITNISSSSSGGGVLFLNKWSQSV